MVRALKPCPDTHERNPKTNRCVKLKRYGPRTPKECKPGFVRSKTGRCMKLRVPLVCSPGKKLNALGNRCIKQKATPKSPGSCPRMTTKKYTTRPGPPFPAQMCRGYGMKGNNGKWYVSKPASNGIYRWVKATANVFKIN